MIKTLHYYLLSLLFLSLTFSQASGQGATCATADPFCTGTTYTFPNSTGTSAPSGPAYGCLTTRPNPAWYYLQIANPGNIQLSVSQVNGSGSGIDVDFIVWGPFSSPTAPCLSGLTSGTIVDCSYSSSATETVNIPNAQTGQYYLFLLTNYSNQSGTISFSQTGGAGTTNCAVLCGVSGFTANPSACNSGTNTYSVSGTLTISNPPASGTLTISNSCGGSQTYNAPFGTSINYNFTGLTPGSGSCTVSATFSADANCNSTVNYNRPAPCPVCAISNVTTTPSACNSGTNTYSVSGAVTFANAPATGTLTVSSSCGGSQTFNAPFTSPTNYNLTGITANGAACTVTASFSATSCSRTANYTAPVSCACHSVSIDSPTHVSCNGGNNGSATATVSGGMGPFTYSWSPSGGTGATASGLTAGTYTVTVTGSNGCSANANVTINQPSAVTATIGAPTHVSCNGGNNGSATVTPGGGTGPYTYAWSPSGGTGATASGLTAGSYTVTVSDSRGCTGTANVTINQPSAVTATIGAPTHVSCNGGNNGSATVTPGGGTGPYTYAWSPSGGTGATASGLTAGSYTVTVSDSRGCTGTANVTINQPSAVTATIGAPTHVSCNGGNNGSATVTPGGGTGPYTYAWSPSGGTGATASGLTAGSYTVTVSDSRGCTGTANVTINQPSAVTATIGAPTHVSCNGGNNGSATVTPGGGTGPYTYAWSPSGGTGATASGLTTGNYTVTVTDSRGCTGTANVTINQPAVLTASIAAPTHVSCNGGNNGSATVTPSGGTAPYSYAWSPSGGTGATASGLTAGSYTVTVTDSRGCTTTANTTISEPTVLSAAITGSTPASCNGGNDGSATVAPSGGTAPYSYAWSPSGGTGATASGLTTGNYTVTVTDNNGCTTTATINITEPSSVSAVISASTNVNCNGSNNGSATVTPSGGTAPYSYAWSPSGGTGATASGLTAGNYTVTVTDDNGCTTTATINITEPASVSAAISASTNVSCNGGNNGSATVTPGGGTGPYSYAWSPSGGTGATASGLTAGNYTVTVTDSRGCTGSGNVNITEPAPLTAAINASSNVSCNGGNDGSATVTPSGGTAPYSYAWSPSGGTTATGTGLTQGSYTVTVTDDNGCTTTATINITEPTALSAAISASSNVSCNGGNDGSAAVAPSGGTAPYSYAWSPSGGTTATGTGLTQGSYTVTVTDDNGCTTTATINITEPTVLSAAISASSNVSCNGGNDGSAAVAPSGGTAPYSYAWSPSGGTGATASGLTAGNYTVTVTDDNSCTTTATINITEPTVLSAAISASSNVSCNGGNDGSATVTPSGGTAPYSYAWSPSGGTTATGTGLTQGSYTVTVTDDNGCTTTATINITEPTVLSAAISASSNVSCNGGNDGSATVAPSGGTAPYSYAWSPSGGTGATASGLTAGNYTVTVTDDNSCTTTATINITEPTVLSAAISASSNVSCNGGNDGSATVTPSGGTAPYSYAWSPSGGTGATASGLTAGNYTVTVTDDNSCTTTATINITEPTVLSAAISASSNVSCNGGNDGSATVAPSGGTAPYSYAWSPSGGTGATASGLTAGNYTVTVTDDNSCTTTATINITEPTVLSAAISASSNVSCNGGNDGSATVTPSGGTAPYSYAWSPSGGTGATASGLTTGNYTVTVTDDNGCTATANINLTEPTLLNAVISASTNVSCSNGNDGSATVTPSGGTAPYSYAWSPSGGTTATGTGLTQGSYTVTVTDDNGCTTTATINITEPTALSAAISASSNISCNGGNNGSATVTPSGGTTPYSYAWSPSGGTGATASGLTVGAYTVTVTDDNGCTATANINLTEPTLLNAVISASTNVSCNGGNNGSAMVTASGGIAPYTYAWSPSGGTGATASGLIAGSYTVTVTDGNNCTTTANISITEPSVLSTSTSSTTANCNQPDGSATVNAAGGTPPYNYSWSHGGGTSATANGLIPGSYNVVVTDANGCTASDNATVPNTPGVTGSLAGQTATSCYNACDGTATVAGTGGTGPYTYSWAPNGGTGATASNLCAGAYTCILTDANGCTSTVSVTITQPPALTLQNNSGNLSICQGESVQLQATAAGGTAPYQIVWQPGNLQGNPTIAPTTTTTYTATVTDANGCTATLNRQVTVNPTPTPAFSADRTSGCPELCVHFSDLSSAAPDAIAAWNWDFGDGSSSNQSNPVHCYSRSGTYSVTLSVVTSNGCSATVTQLNYIEVYPTPVADFSANPQTASMLDPQITFTDLSSGASSWLWNFGDGLQSTSTLQNPTFVYTDVNCFQVSLTVANARGCTSTHTEPVCVEADWSVYVPNAFTPDGDGINDLFSPMGIGLDPEHYDMWIFNRWGEVIFHTRSVSQGWDGTHKGSAAPTDVYVYKINCRNFQGDTRVYHGHISLIR